MKVKELIEFLQKQDPEETVFLVNGVGKGGPLTSDEIFRGVMNDDPRVPGSGEIVLQVYAGW